MDQTEKTLTSGIKKFDGTEFEVWSFLMEGVLDSKGLWYVMDQMKSELTTDDAKTKWDKADRSARTMIMLSLEHDMVKAVMTCATARQMWNKLKTIHSQKSESCKMVLWKEYYDCKMEPGTKVSDYVTKIEFIAMKLRNIGEEVTDNNLISKIVSGLSSDYKHFMSNWLATPAVERTYDNLLPRLLAEESINIDSENKNATAMKMSTTDSSNREKRGKKNIKDMECYHCHKKGHLKRDCRSLKREEKSSRKPNSSDDKKYAVVANTSVNTKQTWLLDSGASFHMTGQRHWIQDYREHSEKIPIRVGNNEYVYALGSGSIEALSTVDGQKITVTMKGVQYVPGISDNLFSQGAADDKGIKVVAKRGKIQLISDDTVIITGNKGHGNLYRLNLTVPMQAKVARSERSLEEWHKVLGHPDVNEIKNLEKKGCTIGFRIISRETSDGQRCGECQQGKCHHVSHPESRRERAKEVLERVHVDLVGALDPPSLGGSKYFMLLRDEYSSYMHVFFLANKTQVLHAMTKYLTVASIQSQRKVQIIRSDNGTEFKNSGMKLLLEKEGIIQEFSAPFTAQQNGEIERANRTVIETARTLLSASRLPISLWGEAVLTAVYLRNRVTNRRNGDKTPFELFYGKVPDYAHLIEFGRELQLLDSKKGVSKFSSKTRDVFMVGYGDRVNTYRCYDPKTNDIVISSDVVIANHVSKERLVSKPHVGITFTIDTSGRDIGPDSSDAMTTSHQEEQHHPSIDLPDETEESARRRCNLDGLSRTDTFIIERNINISTDNQQAARVEARSSQADSSNANRQIVQSSASQIEFPPLPNPRSTSLLQTPIARTSEVYPDLSQVGLKAPQLIQGPQPSGSTTQHTQTRPQQVLSQRANKSASGQSSAGQSPSKIVERTKSAIDWIMKDRPKRSTKSTYARNLSMISEREPTTYEDAVNGENSSKWKDAIKDELEAHDRNNTWRIVPKDPSVKEITAKWVFKVKESSGNEPERYKARLVARGFTQQQGVDYKEIFSPVVRTDSIRMLFSVCAQFDLEYRQFDITTAFLYGSIEEDLFIRPPEGLDIPEGFTCKLQKSLYGLKQAPRCWNAKFSKFLELFNMRPTAADPCVYVANTNERMYLALYVDDGLIFAESSQTIDKFIGYLTKHFMVKEVDSHCFIGIEIVRNRPRNSIFLHQQKYVNKILEKFNMGEAKGAATPLEVGHALNKAETLDGEMVDNIPYAEAIGSLLYCAMATRPDIAYALSVLSKYTSQPRAQHWQGVKRALRYLRQTSDFGIVFQQTEKPKLVCFSDADWAGDHQNRRSTSGLASFLNTGPISFRAQQQPVVALSTTEAEYIAATLAVKDLIWIQRFIEELKLPISSKGKLLCDNQSALKLMKNPEFHQRSKHIDIRFHFIREKYEEGLFDLEYISSENQKADIFTKALAADRFHFLRKMIGCISLSDFKSCDE